MKDFSPDLKTRDIQSLFEEWEDDRGGFKIKWVDDVTCLLVFADAVVGTSNSILCVLSPLDSINQNF